MQDRYTLRFETGERGGEVVHLTTDRITVGRRPDNTLPIAETSVSGEHAELLLEPDGVRVVDRGSTNGTFVNGERVSDRRLAHGDEVRFGNVRLALVDAELAGSAASAAPTASVPAAEGEDVHAVSAEDLERSSQRSKLGIALVAVLLVGGGVAGWFLLRGDGGAGRDARSVEPVAGNLLADSYSFESEGSTWSDAEDAEVAFLRRPAAARSGASGMRAQVEAGESARMLSPAKGCTPGRALRAHAFFDSTEGAAGRIGVVFAFGAEDADAPGEQHAWSAWSTPGTGWTELALTTPVPPGAETARVVLEARADSGGMLDADDAALVSAGAADGPAGEQGGFELWLLGEPPQAMTVVKLNRVLVGDLRALDPGRPLDSAALGVERSDERFALRLPDGGADRVLTLRVEPAAASGGVVSLGDGGRRVHGPQFERDGVDALLLGKGYDLVQFTFASPVTITGRPEANGVRITARVGTSPRVGLEVDFHAETAAARGLKQDAIEARAKDRMGEAYAAWRRLRDVFPYDEELLAEAEREMQEIAQSGLDALQSVREDVERARFFRLREGYAECRREAEAVGERYAGTVVEEDALSLAREIEAEASDLETELEADEVRRLKGILAALEGSDSPSLASAVRSYLETRYGVQD